MIIDAIVALLVLVLGLRGLRRGFLRETFSFAGWLGGALAAVWLLYDLTPVVSERLRIPAAVGGLIAFVGVFLVVSTAFWLAGWILSGLVRVTVILRPLDKLAGFLLGAVEGLLLAGILVFVFRESPFFPSVREQVESSTLSQPLAEQTAALFAVVRDEAVRRRNEGPAEEAAPPKTARRPRRAPTPPDRL